MTPEELDRGIWASYKGRENELRDQMRSAWYVAHLLRQQRLPSMRLWMEPVAQKNTVEELARRKAEHEELIRRMERKRSS